MSKPPRKQPKFTAAQVIAALPGTGGIRSHVAKKLGCAWHTAQKYIDEYPTVKQAHEDECSLVDDTAESNVVKAIIGGDVETSKWWLSKRRRDKFPNESRVQVTGADNGPIQIATFDYNKTVAALGQLDDADSQLATTEA